MVQPSVSPTLLVIFMPSLSSCILSRSCRTRYPRRAWHCSSCTASARGSRKRWTSWIGRRAPWRSSSPTSASRPATRASWYQHADTPHRASLTHRGTAPFMYFVMHKKTYLWIGTHTGNRLGFFWGWFCVISLDGWQALIHLIGMHCNTLAYIGLL